VNQLSDITTFLDKLHETLRTWVIKKRKSPTDTVSDWREAWHPENVQVWGRIAKNSLDSHAVKWFHGSYQNSQSIKNSDLTGKIGQIGRIWHRMYPRYLTTPEGTLKPTKEYVELLTIFPDESDKTEDFLGFLESSSDFTKLWGLEN
jgi:CRISPR-associated protein Cmr6